MISDGLPPGGYRTDGLETTSSTPAVEPAALLPMIWVDASQLTRECVAGAIKVAQPHLLIQTCASVEACLNHEGYDPKLAVFYSHTEEAVDIDQIEAMHAAYPAARLIVLSDALALAPDNVRDILARDVAGFILTRRAGLQMVVSAINLVQSGGTFVPRDFLFMDHPTNSMNDDGKATVKGKFTPRELEVMDLIRLGRPNKVIAEELNMSASTVKVHVRNIMQKMGVANRTQVALGAGEYFFGDS